MPRSPRALGAIALALGARATTLPAQSASAAAFPAPAGEPRTLQAGGVTRRYFLHLAPAWHRGMPLPLVLVFHGGGGRASGIAPHTGFSRLADSAGFVVAYPQGLNGRWNDGRGFASATHDDVGFVRALLDTLGRAADVYAGCREGRAVELYTIDGGGHTWPGGPPVGGRSAG